jgi:hypothetical protein
VPGLKASIFVALESQRRQLRYRSGIGHGVFYPTRTRGRQR